MTDKISRRGVYRDLSISPYEYQSPYGDIFKFKSKKKLEIYTRDIKKEIKRIENIFERNSLLSFLPEEVMIIVIKNVYRAFYRKIEG